MTIKPVLVPDHDAAELRGLMDRFAEATTGPTRQQLAESRAAVAAAQENISEGAPDVMRHTGDKTIRVVKRGGVPIGEIGTDAEASPGNGPYYVKLYDGSYDAVGFDSAEEALEELRYAVKQMSEGVAEGEENNPVVNAITRRIVLQRTDLLSKYGPEKIGQAVDEVADFVGDVEEIGSSDVSGWVRHVEQMLGNMSEGRDVPYNDPNLSKAYNLGYQAYKGLKNNPQLAQAAQDRIEADFPQYARMWTRGYQDGERFDQEKNMSEDQAVSPSLNMEAEASELKPLQKVWYKNERGNWLDGEVGRVYPDGRVSVSLPGGMDIIPAELLTTQRPAGAVAESIDPVEQLRADIRRFAR